MSFGAMLFCFVSLIINYDNEFCFLLGLGGKLWLYFMMIILYRDQNNLAGTNRFKSSTAKGSFPPF